MYLDAGYKCDKLYQRKMYDELEIADYGYAQFFMELCEYLYIITA